MSILSMRSVLIGVSQRRTFWPFQLASKYDVTCHARNMLIKNGGSPLSYAPPPGPQKISGPYIEVENSTLSYIVHRMLIRKLLTRKRDLSYSQYSNTNIAKNAEKQNSCICRPVSSECVQKHWRQNILPHLKSV